MLLLKFARINRGLTQSVLGQMSRITQTDVGLIEMGRLIPKPEELRRLARALGVAPSDAPKLLEEIRDPLRPMVEPEPAEPQPAEATH